MNFICPRCSQHLVKLTDRACVACGQSLTVGGVSQLYWERARTRLREATAVQCPACRQPNPISAISCRHCGHRITIDIALDTTLRLAKAPVRSFFSHPPRSARWLVQLAFLGLSAWGSYYMVGWVAGTWFVTLLIGSAYGVVFLTAIFFLVPRIFPRSLLLAVARRASGATKLALILNGLSLLLYSVVLLGGLWTAALAPALAVVVVYVAGSLLGRSVWPEYVKARESFEDAGERPVDPTKPQGRKAYWWQ